MRKVPRRSPVALASCRDPIRGSGIVEPLPGCRMRRGGFARPRGFGRVRVVLIAAIAMCLSFALAAGARVGTAHHSRTSAASFPLSVRHISLSTLRGRIVGTATIANSGNARVRSTIGSLALKRDSGARPTGVLTFSVPSLSADGSKSLHLRTRPLRALPIGSGTYTASICADIYSQIRRFARNTNCSRAARLAISTGSRPKASGPMPQTIVTAGLRGVSRSSAAVFRFVSTFRRSSFECSLDGGPWIACRSPKRYHALVNGRHTLDARAISPLGRRDPTPAHQLWTVRAVASSKTYSVGGTVSGLSGTVVLQDNGRDDLSVSAKWHVHVRHPAGHRGAYKVTVKTNPSGQTCTVSGGSGHCRLG